MTQAQTLTPLAVGSDEGEAIWWFGSLAVIKASAAATGAAMSLIEITAPPNLEGPLHVHHREEEGFYILEGSATFQIGDQTVEAKAGDYLLGPRDIPHKFDTGPEGCRMLFIMTPGGFEDLVREMGEPAASRTLPPLSDQEPDMARIAQIADKYGCELVEG
jgi:mannose-6-phosphate isomerase-like protein (cupin superfamily)